ncbi:SprT family protein [Metasolibacillus meyeri]|uniref:SprT family protein n=1 Tax=Metasolibacillus meyeri TaxID=1071052 RepID=UPI000D321714|nr:SprT family protein [Metasolibacillus meyeri]
MDDLQLQQLVEQLSEQRFQLPFKHKAYFNSRLRTTGGRYMLKSHNIEVNKRYYEHFGVEELNGIILHELCHYHLHLQGKGYKHRDQDFRMLLKKVGAPRFCSTIEKEEKGKSRLYNYHCIDCGQSYRRKRKVNVKSYCCSKCRGAIYLIENKR